MKQKIKDWASLLCRYAIGIGIILWLNKTNQLNFNVLLDIDAQTVSLALGLCILQLVLSAWRVKLLLASHHILASLPRCILYNSVGIFYSTVLPGGMSGDAVRAYYFWRCNRTIDCTKSALIGALITDRLIGTLAMLFVGLVAATISAKTIGISSNFLGMSWFAFIFGVGMYVFVCSTHKYEWKRLTLPRFKLLFERIQRVLAKLDLKDYPNRVLCTSVVFSIIIHISSVIVIFIFATRLGSGLDFSQVMTVAPVGLLVNALPISPGGLGVGEKGFDFLFALIGGQHGGSVFMISRIFIFSPAILGAAFAFFLLLNRRRNAVLQLQNDSILNG